MQALMASGLMSLSLLPAALPSPQGPQVVALAPDELYRSALPSLAAVDVERKDGSVATGSGFLTIGDGLLVTAHHVIEGAAKVSVRFADGEAFEATGLVDRDPQRDVALIRVRVFGRPLLLLQPQLPQVGSRAYALGSPRGMDFSITEGLVSQVQVRDGSQLLQFSSAASPGSSGGPLIDTRGRVMGVASWQRTDAQNLNFAIPARYVLALDSTLPTKPWESVPEVRTAVASPAPQPRPQVLQKPEEILEAAKTIAIVQEREDPDLLISAER